MARVALPAGWRERYVGAMRARAIGKIEVTANRGQLVDYVQRRNGGTLGEFWCMDAVGATGVDAFGKSWPLLLSGSCMQQRQWANKKGALRTRAEFDARRTQDPMLVAGWIFLVIDPTKPNDGPELKGHAHHTGSVGDVSEATSAIAVNGPAGGFLTIEGNAADPKNPASRNGDGWYHGRERGAPTDRATYEFIEVPAI